MKKKKYRKVLGVGYPWYHWQAGDLNKAERNYFHVSLSSRPITLYSSKIIKDVPLAPVEGAWQKVKLIVEYEK